LKLKLGLPVGLAGAVGPIQPQAGLTQSGYPNFNTQKEVLVMRVVLTLGDKRTEILPLVRLGCVRLGIIALGRPLGAGDNLP
jgi:hypothetical protein